MNIIGLRDLRENMDKYVAQINKGRSFTVVRRSRPVFKIVPPSEDTEKWETVIDFTKNCCTINELYFKKGSFSATKKISHDYWFRPIGYKVS